jgi:predicted nucleic acid-binding protein
VARAVICIDTNYLILGLVPGSPEGDRLRRWSAGGTRLVAPTVVWFEFLCGPVTARQADTMRAFLHDIIPFGEPHAACAATLFNHAGRRRSTRVDAMIAATALVADVPLATNNAADFSAFCAAGLRFA